MGTLELVYNPPHCIRGFGSFIPSLPWACIQHVPHMTYIALQGGSLGSRLMWTVTLEQTLRTMISLNLMNLVSRSLPTLNIPFNILQEACLGGETSFGVTHLSMRRARTHGHKGTLEWHPGFVVPLVRGPK